MPSMNNQVCIWKDFSCIFYKFSLLCSFTLLSQFVVFCLHLCKRQNIKKNPLSELNMSDVAIFPADKGRATVLMNKEEYHSKLTQLIQSGTYRLVKKDPTKTQETINYNRCIKKT